MFVQERMTRQPVTANPEMPVADALALMRERKIRRLPVIDHAGHLVGIVSDRDLLQASPSPATSLSVWEITYLLSRITVKSVMTTNVITVTPDEPLEDAARIMADSKIGGLPVVENGALVGIITETDLFKVFLGLLGARTKGIRATVSLQDKPGQLANVTRAIADRGGLIVAIAELPETTGTTQVMVKATGISAEDRAFTIKVLPDAGRHLSAGRPRGLAVGRVSGRLGRSFSHLVNKNDVLAGPDASPDVFWGRFGTGSSASGPWDPLISTPCEQTPMRGGILFTQCEMCRARER